MSRLCVHRQTDQLHGWAHDWHHKANGWEVRMAFPPLFIITSSTVPGQWPKAITITQKFITSCYFTDVGAYTCATVMLKGTALRWMVMSLLKTGQHCMTVFTMCLWTRNPAPSPCLSSLPLKKTLCPSSVIVSPKSSISFHGVQGYSICTCPFCVSSLSFFAALSVLVFMCQWWCLFHKSSVMHQ